MKRSILKSIQVSFVLIMLLVSCSEEEELKTCVLQRVSIESPESYQEILYNDDGTIASVNIIFSGTWNQRYDYVYESDKLFIYLTDLAVTDQFFTEVRFDSQGRPVYKAYDEEHYERYVYSGNRLDHIMWAGKDSIVYTYSGANKNPDKVEFYGYNAANQTWTLGTTTTLTYDDKINPLKGLILPYDNSMEHYFLENNNTSYSSEGFTWNRAYTYNTEGYPVSRTLTSSHWDYIETTDFTYVCE